LFDVIRYAKDQGITVSISTNGSYLNDTNSRKLIASGLDYLIIAFDGATPQTYHKYRKGSNFYQVKANVERFLELKQTLNSPVHVTLQMIRMADTKGEIAAFRTLWDRIGVDCIRVREDLLKNEDAEPHLFTKRRPHRPCFFLWRGPLFVQAGGTLIPCPYYHGSPPFADLNTQSVDEAWNSPKMRELRQAQVSGDLTKFPLCASCPRYQPQALLAAASFFVNTRWIRRYVPLLERIQQLVGRRFFE
jgi:MoaA/NifB/PqqE/SkfB family radical SAM enzyme